MCRRSDRTFLWFHRLAVLCGLLVAFVLQLTFLDTFGLWDGERHTIFHAARPLSEFPVAFREYTAHPPLWFALIHFLLGAEPAVWILRFPAVLAGTATIAAGYALARRVLPRAWVPAVVWLMAISPLLLRWSQSVRMYTAFMLFSTLSFYFTLRLLEARRNLAWLGLALSALLNLYTHYFAIFPLFAQAGFLAVFVGWSFFTSARRGGTGEGASRPDTWRIVRRALLSAVIVGAGYLPWFLAVARFNLIERQVVHESKSPGVGAASLELVYRLFEEVAGGTGWLTWGLLLLAVAGLFLLLARKRYRHAGLISLGLTVPLMIVVVTDPRRFHAKYVAYAVPLVAMLLVAGIAALQDLARNVLRQDRTGSAISVGLLVGALGLVSASNLWLDYQYYAGDASAFEKSTEPGVWPYRGPWPQFMQAIQQGESGFMFLLSKKSVKGQRCKALCQQASTQLYVTPGAYERLVTVDWTAVPALDVWWIGPVLERETTFGMPDDVWLQTVGDASLAQQVVDGPNQQLWRTHARVVEARDILPNGSLESLSGWRGNLASIELVNGPVVDGDRAVRSLRYNETVRLRSDALPVEPGVLLQASMQVHDLTLTFHEPTPRLVLRFRTAEQEAIKRSLSTYYSLPYPASGVAAWEQVTVQALTPADAATVELSIEFENPCPGNPLAVVDDVRLTAIQWEPLP